MTILPRNCRSLVAALGLVAVVAASVGCSYDRHVFRSTAVAPKSVAIVSAETGNTLWSMDVPINQQLMLDFSRNGKGGEVYSSADVPADAMRWETWSLDAIPKYSGKRKGGKKLDGDKVKLPGEFILIEVDIRAPELAASAN